MVIMKKLKNLYGEVDENSKERLFKHCPTCYSIMLWNKYWKCTYCEKVVKADISDCDGIAIVKT